MNRFALTLMLAAAPLLAAGMLAQSENVSGDASANISSVSANSANQFFRGHWIDGSNFTQDTSYFADEFSAGGNFPAALNHVEFASRRIASALTNSHTHIQRSEKTIRAADSKVTSAAAQLAQFNALYASLIHRGLTHSGEVSLSVYHQLMDQQFVARKHTSTAARARFIFDSIANIEKKSTGVSAAEMEMVRMTAQRTERDADIQAVTAARLKRAIQQRGYAQRPATPQRNHQSGEVAPGRTQQYRVVAAGKMERVHTGTKVSGGLTAVESLQRLHHLEVSAAVGADRLI